MSPEKVLRGDLGWSEGHLAEHRRAQARRPEAARHTAGEHSPAGERQAVHT